MKIDKQKVWNDVLASIKVSVSPPVFSTWLSQTHLSSLDQKENRFVVEVGCVSSFVKTTIEKRYYGLIQDSLSKTLGKSCDLVFIVKQFPSGNGEMPKIAAPLFEEPVENDDRVLSTLAKSRVSPSFTFDNFAVSSSNQMAFAAAEAVAKTPGKAYNPLFLWGGVGVGKTHLMNSVGYSVIKKDSETRAIFCTGEDFTNDIVEGIRNKTTQVFREKYRKLKVLLIDDIQFIAGKDAVQEEFFHTFNAVTSAGGQIILTSDRPPSEISKLEGRLRSRFEAGLIVDIAPPDFELRCAIVQIKSKEKEIELPMDLVQLIAGNLEEARKIEGFLTRLSTEMKLKSVIPDEEIIKGLLGKGSVVYELKKKQVRPEQVVDAVTKYFSVSRRALLGNARARIVARPRQILMYILRTELALPLEEVGELVDRDHSTVIHAVNTIATLASSDVRVREDILGIKNSL